MHAMSMAPETQSEPVSAGSRLGIGLAGAIAGFAAIVPLAIAALAVPKFMEIFRDFGVALPLLSRAVIDIGTALATPLGVVVILMIGLGAAGAVCLAWRVHRVVGIGALLACLAWLCISLGLLAIGLFLPLIAMTESLQQGGAV